MSFILGMDTGGTYTDGVIVDSDSRKIICKAKALTTRENLTVGIKKCIEGLQFDRMDEISLVSLSTTLATNAIVEGRGARVGLIYMGADLEEEVPAEIVVKIKGRFNIKGDLQEDIDISEIKGALEDMKGLTESVAVSGYAGVRNPKHEQEIKRLAREILNVPVICAHELTSALGFHHRTVTAVLNGRIIPVIDRMLKSTRGVLEEHGIYTPVMVVRGDGTLMTEELARDKPIETVLSGPAASIIGGMALTGNRDALILDMGGTTTDIAAVSKGSVHVKKEGAKVGGWHTRVQAVDISTFGIGGDSKIYLDQKGDIMISGEKVWPLCMAVKKYPKLLHELRSFRRRGELKQYYSQEADCFMYTGNGSDSHKLDKIGNGETSAVDISKEVKTMLKLLKNEPHSLTYLAKAVGNDPENVDLTPFVKAEILTRISVTPTDILHVLGKYTSWDRAASFAGIDILARRKDMGTAEFANMAAECVNNKIAMTLIQSAADFEGEDLSFARSKEAMYLIVRALGKTNSSFLSPGLGIRKTVVAIGAPAGVWAQEAGKLFNAQVVVPNDADVANAYGAAIGQITERVEILINTDGVNCVLNMPWGREVYKTREEAMFYAVHEGRKHTEHLLADAGCRGWDIKEEIFDIMAEIRGKKGQTCVGSRMVITGTGKML